MTTAKSEVFIALWQENCYLVGGLTFARGIKIYWGIFAGRGEGGWANFWVVGKNPAPPSPFYRLLYSALWRRQINFTLPLKAVEQKYETSYETTWNFQDLKLYKNDKGFSILHANEIKSSLIC